MVAKGAPSASSKGADWAAISNAAKRAQSLLVVVVVVSFLFFPPFFFIIAAKAMLHKSRGPSTVNLSAHIYRNVHCRYYVH